mgnify:CR=1 FL=1
MSKPKLSVGDFYAQFHGLEHHNDPGDYTFPLKHILNPALPKKHKGLDLKALRNRKKKRYVVVQKDQRAINHELARIKGHK